MPTCFCVHIGIVCRSARKISRCARNDNAGARGILATRHKSLAIPPCFQIFGAAIPRIVIPSAAEGSFLHCGQYHISTGRETMPCCCVFLRSHRRSLSVCKEDFSLRSKLRYGSPMSFSHQSLETTHPCFSNWWRSRHLPHSAVLIFWNPEPYSFPHCNPCLNRI